MSLLVGIVILSLAIALGGLAALSHDHARRAMPPIRTFAVVAAAAIALLHLLPEAVADAGWGTLLAAGVGMLGPALLERIMLPGGDHRHDAPTTALAMGYAAVIAHQASEGATLAALAQTGTLTAAIVIAIAAHTTPLSMGVAMRAMELKGGPGNGGRRATGLALAGVTAATVAGAVAGRLVGVEQLETVEPWLLATIAGLLLHALSHGAFPVPPVGTRGRIVDSAAGLLGLVLAVIGVEPGGWIQHVAWPLRALGVVLVGGAILLRSFWGALPGARHRPAAGETGEPH